MTWSWFAFFTGIAASFLISFGAIVGWWFLILKAHDGTPPTKDVYDIRRRIQELSARDRANATRHGGT